MKEKVNGHRNTSDDTYQEEIITGSVVTKKAKIPVIAGILCLQVVICF